MNKSLLVVGMFRSGTNLVASRIQAAFDISVHYPEPLHPERWECLDSSYYKSYHRRPNLQEHWSKDFARVSASVSESTEGEKLECYLSKLFDEGALVRETRLCLSIKWFAEKFPHIPIVFVVRDPRAVAYSYTKRSAFAKGSSLKHRTLSVFGNRLDFLKRRFLDAETLSGDAYWTNEYLDILSEDPHWREYSRRLKRLPSLYRYLGLWRIFCESASRDLPHAKHVVVRYEDFCSSMQETLAEIASLIGVEVPKNSCAEIETGSVPGHKFHRALSEKWKDEWKGVKGALWSDAIAECEMAEVMDRFSYSR